MIETRDLTREEVKRLIDESPDSETRNLKVVLEDFGMDGYDFFRNFGIKQAGILAEGRPIYIGVITKNENNEYEIWTVVNKDVKEQIALYKISKRIIHGWKEKYKEIFATMEKVSPANIKWTERLGFKKVSEDDKTIKFSLSEKEGVLNV